MNNRIELENQLIHEIHTLPIEVIQDMLHLALSVKKLAHASDLSAKNETGLCGIWQDSRNSAEIVEEIMSYRSSSRGTVL